jgi:hypothetical protein
MGTMTFKIDGFDDLNKQLKNISKQVAKESQYSGELSEILNDDFINRNTNYNSYQEFMQSLPIDISKEDNLQFIENDLLDTHICDQTKHSSWNRFINAAAEEFMAKRLKKIFK